MKLKEWRLVRWGEEAMEEMRFFVFVLEGSSGRWRAWRLERLGADVRALVCLGVKDWRRRERDWRLERRGEERRVLKVLGGREVS